MEPPTPVMEAPNNVPSASLLPSAVFLDTEVFDGQNFNFASANFGAFIAVCKQHSIKLLLPDPTEREIRRHLTDRCKAVLLRLDEVRSKHPFLRAWPHLPKARGQYDVSVFDAANGELGAFLTNFDVVKLGYDSVSMVDVMDWYDGRLPPFRGGSKQKEFPDALAIAMLAHCAKSQSWTIAVVSNDGDLKLACERFSPLSHFSSLSRLTEHLVSGASNIEKLRTLVQSHLPVLEADLLPVVEALRFGHVNWEYSVIETVVHNVWITDFRVLAVGESDCTIAFEGEGDVEALLAWSEVDTPEGSLIESQRRLMEQFEFSGSAKARLAPHQSEVEGFTLVTIEHNAVDLTESPKDYW